MYQCDFIFELPIIHILMFFFFYIGIIICIGTSRIFISLTWYSERNSKNISGSYKKVKVENKKGIN